MAILGWKATYDQILDDDPKFNSDYGSDGDSVEANVVESEDENDGALAQNDDETQEIDVKDCVSIKLAIASLLEEQQKIGNDKFLKAYFKVDKAFQMTEFF
ncbi:hypothetical protein K3495_g17154 [Podosphaera aphanis]|nr:hypothetical protein K3495_g17154 [Podosphaera aphanis]